MLKKSNSDKIHHPSPFAMDLNDSVPLSTFFSNHPFFLMQLKASVKKRQSSSPHRLFSLAPKIALVLQGMLTQSMKMWRKIGY